jgi:hypothetical protein
VNELVWTFHRAAAPSPPLLLHGRAGTGKSGVARAAAALGGAPVAIVDLVAIASIPDLFGSLLRAIARAVVSIAERAAARAGAPRAAGRARLLAALLHPARARSGAAAARELVCWGEGPGGELFEALVEATGARSEGARLALRARLGLAAGAGGAPAAPAAPLPAVRTFLDFARLLTPFAGITAADVGVSAPGTPRDAPLALWLVLEGAERLAAAAPTVFRALFKLRELVRLSRAVVQFYLRGGLEGRNTRVSVPFMVFALSPSPTHRSPPPRCPPPPFPLLFTHSPRCRSRPIH